MSSLKISSPLQAESCQWFVYLLRCADQSLYCGITIQLEKRLKQHNGHLAGGAKYTKARQPCFLVYFEVLQNRSEALKVSVRPKTPCPLNSRLQLNIPRHQIL